MRILAIDIETSPNVVYTWGLFDQNVGLNQIVSTSEIMCFAAKWLDAKRIQFYSTHKDGREEMVRQAHRLLDEADVLLHYNGTAFDVPHLYREFIEAGYEPPSPFKEIDLLKTARRFKFQSRKLEHVSTKLGLAGKVKHEGFELWKKCLAGDDAAWRRMERYNRQDVRLLEELYEIMQPWVKMHPNRALFDGNATGCTACGSTHLQRRGVARTATGVYPQYQCQGCGKYLRGTKREAGTDIVAVT